MTINQEIAKYFVDPTLNKSEVAQRIRHFDPRYYMSYYAIDAINFTPADLSSALDKLDASYLPLVVLEAAGVPLAPSFEEQKRILQRCAGSFYGCNGGSEARRIQSAPDRRRPDQGPVSHPASRGAKVRLTRSCLFAMTNNMGAM